MSIVFEKVTTTHQQGWEFQTRPLHGTCRLADDPMICVVTFWAFGNEFLDVTEIEVSTAKHLDDIEMAGEELLDWIATRYGDHMESIRVVLTSDNHGPITSTWRRHD